MQVYGGPEPLWPTEWEEKGNQRRKRRNWEWEKSAPWIKLGLITHKTYTPSVAVALNFHKSHRLEAFRYLILSFIYKCRITFVCVLESRCESSFGFLSIPALSTPLGRRTSWHFLCFFRVLWSPNLITGLTLPPVLFSSTFELFVSFKSDSNERYQAWSRLVFYEPR